MALKNFDVVIVSAFGRGHWLAREFQRSQMKVLLLDVSAQLGSWPGEDSEGPFGVSKLDRFESSFFERLQEGDPIETVENGWTFWLKNGPLEFKGPLTLFHADQHQISIRWLELLSKGEVLPKSEIEGVPFVKSWPLALAQQMAATQYRPAALALDGGRPIPLTANFGVRFATRQGLGRNLQWLQNGGVTTSDHSVILDVALSSRNEIAGLELKGELSGLVRGLQFVWNLTDAETQFLSPKLREHLYSGVPPTAAWCWVRYRLASQAKMELERIPLHTVVIEDQEAPWTHENVIILQKTASEGRLDAWIRIPAPQRFNKDYLGLQAQRILQVMHSRLPQAGFEVQALPQEASYTSQELGEPRIPVWQGRPTKGRRKLKNLSFESPENRENHTLDCEFDHQLIVRNRVQAWWQAKLLKDQKAQKETSP